MAGKPKGVAIHPVPEKRIMDEVDKREARRAARKAEGRESDVRKRVKAALTQYGFHFHSAIAGPFSKVGVEDETVCIFGRYVLVESKNTETDRPTPSQMRNAQSALTNGAIVLLIHHQNIHTFEEWVGHCNFYTKALPGYISLQWPDKWL